MARTPPAKGRASLTPFYVILGVVALAVVAYLVYRMSGGGGNMATHPTDVTLNPAELSQVQGIAVGSDNAPVVVYEFADFQCPACGQYASFVTPLVKERLVEPGLVRFVYYDFPLVGAHPNAFLAARAARCANDQEKFWEYHDMLYARQPTWSAMGDPSDFFVELAGTAGLDRGAFGQCLRSDRFADDVTRSLRLGESLGVQGTPTVFVNGKRLPEPPSFSELEQIVRQEAGSSGGAAAAPGAATDTAAQP